jgi:hypothetical protein
MNQGKRGRPKKDPNQIITPAQIEQARIKIAEKERVAKYKKLQLYYYFTIGREYLNSSIVADYDRVKILRKLDILDKLNIPHLLGSDKILSPANLTDWFENLYQYRFELQRLRIVITPKTRLASAAQRVVRLLGLDIVYLDRVLENGRAVHRYRGANAHSDDDQIVLNKWLDVATRNHKSSNPQSSRF